MASTRTLERERRSRSPSCSTIERHCSGAGKTCHGGAAWAARRAWTPAAAWARAGLAGHDGVLRATATPRGASTRSPVPAGHDGRRVDGPRAVALARAPAEERLDPDDRAGGLAAHQLLRHRPGRRRGVPGNELRDALAAASGAPGQLILERIEVVAGRRRRRSRLGERSSGTPMTFARARASTGRAPPCGGRGPTTAGSRRGAGIRPRGRAPCVRLLRERMVCAQLLGAEHEHALRAARHAGEHRFMANRR